MASKHVTVWKALKAYLESMPDIPQVAYGGASFDPPSDGAQYLIVDDVRFDAQRKYLGTSAPTWQTGSLMIGVMIPLIWDDIQSAEYAGKIADYFEQDTKMTHDGITVSVSRQPTVSGAGYRDGNMFRIPLVIPWEGWV